MAGSFAAGFYHIRARRRNRVPAILTGLQDWQD
jgi:hypothetical protein